MAGYGNPWRVSEEKVLREQLPEILAGRCEIKSAINRVRGKLPHRSFDALRVRFGLLVKEARARQPETANV